MAAGVGGLVPSDRRRRLRSIESAALAGIVCAVGWMAALAGLLAAPGLGADDHQIDQHYADEGTGTAAVLWLQVLVFSTIAFLWFVAVIRSRIGDREPKLAGTAFFAGSVLLAGLLFLGAALLAAPAVMVAVSDRQPDPATAAMLRVAAAIVLSVMLPRIATLVMFSTANLGRASGALPRWLVGVTVVVGVAELINVTVSTPEIFVFPAWIALVSIVLLVTHPERPFRPPAP